MCMCLCACEKDSAACLCGKRSTKQRGGKTQVKDNLLWVHLKASWQALIKIKSKIDIDPRKNTDVDWLTWMLKFGSNDRKNSESVLSLDAPTRGLYADPKINKSRS